MRATTSLHRSLGEVLAEEDTSKYSHAAVQSLRVRLQTLVDQPAGGRPLFVDRAPRRAPSAGGQRHLRGVSTTRPNPGEARLVTRTLLALTGDVRATQLATCALISIGDLEGAIETAYSGLKRLGDTQPLAAVLHESAGFAHKLSGRYDAAIRHFAHGAASEIDEVATASAASGLLLTASLRQSRAAAWFISRATDIGADVVIPLALKKARRQELRNAPDLDTSRATRLAESCLA